MAIEFDPESKAYSDGTTTLALNNGVYEINTVDQLKLFRDAVNAGNTFAGQTVRLITSIDLNNAEWTPIGKTGATFEGTFDGNGKTVSNLYINTPDDACVGFFNDTNSATTIKDLTINNVNISGDNYAGAIVGYGYLGKISNCNVTGTIKISGRWFVGGISGHGYAAVDSCEVIAEEGSDSFIKGSAGYVGGIFGYRAEDTSISNCTVSNITISGSSWGVGGISGIAQYGSVIEGCAVENTTISATDLNGDNVGLIAGANLGALETSEGQPANPAVLLNNKVDAATIENFMVDGKTVENPPMLGEDNNTGNPGKAAIIGDVTLNEAGEITGGTLTVVGAEKDDVVLSDALSLASDVTFSQNGDGTFDVVDIETSTDTLLVNQEWASLDPDAIVEYGGKYYKVGTNAFATMKDAAAAITAETKDMIVTGKVSWPGNQTIDLSKATGKTTITFNDITDGSNIGAYRTYIKGNGSTVVTFNNTDASCNIFLSDLEEVAIVGNSTVNFTAYNNYDSRSTKSFTNVGKLTVTEGSTCHFANANQFGLGDTVISGAGTIKSSGTLIVSGDNSGFTGVLEVASGVQMESVKSGFANASQIINNGTMYCNASGTFTYDQTITGNGMIKAWVQNVGTEVVLSGDLSGYTGQFDALSGNTIKLNTALNDTVNLAHSSGAAGTIELNGNGTAKDIIINSTTNTTTALKVFANWNNITVQSNGNETSTVLGTIYFGGNGNAAAEDLEVTLSTINQTGGKSIGNLYFGGIGNTVSDSADADANAIHVVVDTIYGTIVGGGQQSTINGDITFEVVTGASGAQIVGAGDGNTVNGNISINVNNVDDTSVGNIIGGRAVHEVTGDISIAIADGTVGNVYGLNSGDVNGTSVGNIQIDVTGGTVSSIRGGNSTSGKVPGMFEADGVKINLTGGEVTGKIYGGSQLSTESIAIVVDGGQASDIYAGSKYAAVGGTSIEVKAGTVGSIYGGGAGGTDDIGYSSVGTSAIRVSGGTVNGEIYGGGTEGDVTTSATVTITGGTITDDIYGGGYGDATVTTAQVVVSGEDVTFTEGKINIYGGGNGTGEGSAGSNNTVGSASVSLSGINQGEAMVYVYGGGVYGTQNVAESKVTVTDSSVWAVYGGTAGGYGAVKTAEVVIDGSQVSGDVYGGGAMASATTGSASVTLTGGSTVSGDVYGGGFNGGVTGDVAVNISGAKVEGSVNLGSWSSSSSATVVGAATLTVSGGNNSINGVTANGITHGTTIDVQDGSAIAGVTSDGALTIKGNGVYTSAIQAKSLTAESLTFEVTQEELAKGALVKLTGSDSSITKLEVKLTEGDISSFNGAQLLSGNFDPAGLTITLAYENTSVTVKEGVENTLLVNSDWTGVAEGTLVLYDGAYYQIGTNAFDTIDKAVATDVSSKILVLDGSYSGNQYFNGHEVEIGTADAAVDFGAYYVFGGALNEDTGDINLKFVNGSAGRIYGAAADKEGDYETGNITIDIGKDVTASGRMAAAKVDAGSLTTGAVTVNYAGNSADGSYVALFGGAQAWYKGSSVTHESVTVNVSGELTDVVYAAGQAMHGGWVTVNNGVTTNVTGGSIGTDGLLGGGFARSDIASTDTAGGITIAGGTWINISGGEISDVYGGTHTYSLNGQLEVVSTITGGTHIYMTGGKVGNVQGGGYTAWGSKATIDSTYISVSGGTVIGDVQGGSYVVGGGKDVNSGNSSTITNGTTVVISDSADIQGSVYGGSWVNWSTGTAASYIGGASTVEVNGGQIAGNVAGGGVTSAHDDDGTISTLISESGSTEVTLTGGTIQGSVIGGGVAIDGYNKGAKLTNSVSSTSVVIDGATVNGSVIAGGYAEGVNTTTSVTEGVAVAIKSGTIEGDVYGGSIAGSIGGDSTISISGGDILGGVYGADELGTITGSSTLSFDNTRDYTASMTVISGFDDVSFNGGTVNFTNVTFENSVISVSDTAVLGESYTFATGAMSFGDGTQFRFGDDLYTLGVAGDNGFVFDYDAENGLVAHQANVDTTTFVVNSGWSSLADRTEVEYDGGSYTVEVNAFDGINAAIAGIADDTETISIAAGTYSDATAAQFTDGVAVVSDNAVFSNVWSFGINSDTAASFNMDTAENFTVSGTLQVGQFYAEKNANVYVVIAGDLTTVGSFGAKLATQVDITGSVTVTPPSNGAAQVLVHGTMNVTGKLDSTSGPMAAVMVIGTDSYDATYGKGGVLNVTGENASVTLRGNTGGDMPVQISGLSSLNVSDGASFTHENGSLKNKGTVNVDNGTLSIGGTVENSGTVNFSNAVDANTIANSGTVNFNGGTEFQGEISGSGNVQYTGEGNKLTGDVSAQKFIVGLEGEDAIPTSLEISGGATVEVTGGGNSGRIGFNTDVVITGDGTTFTDKANLTMDESATLEISNGAKVSIGYIATGGKTDVTGATLNLTGGTGTGGASAIGGLNDATEFNVNDGGVVNALNGLVIGHRETKDGLVNVNAGGELNVSGGALKVSGLVGNYDVQGNGTLNVNGGTVTADNSGFDGLIVGDAWDGASGILNVTNGGSIYAGYSIQLNSTSKVTIDGGSMSAKQMNQSEGGKLSIVNGGNVTLSNSYFAMGGKITVGGDDSGNISRLETEAGAELRPASLGGDYTGHEGETVLNIEKNGEVILGTGLIIGHRETKDATVNVNEGGHMLVTGGTLYVSGITPNYTVQGNGELNINGGTVEVTGDAGVEIGDKNGIATGVMNINGGSFSAQSVTNNGAVNLTGAATVDAEFMAEGTGLLNLNSVAFGAETSINDTAGYASNTIGSDIVMTGANTLSDGAFVSTGWQKNLKIGYGTGTDSDSVSVSGGSTLKVGGAAYVGSSSENKGAGAFQVNVSGAGSSFAGSGYDGSLYLRADGAINVSDQGTASFSYSQLKGAVNVDAATFSAINAVITATGGVTLSSDALFSVEQEITLGGDVSMDYTSTVSFETITDDGGSLTIDMSGYEGGVYKLLDYTGSASYTEEQYKALIGESNWNDYFTIVDNDLFASDVDTSVLKVNAAWSGLDIGDKVADDGYYYGFNAFDTFQDAYNSGMDTVTILICSDLTGVTGELGIDAPYRSDIRISSDDGNAYTLTFASPNDDGLYAWNPGQKITIDKEITLTNMAQLMAVDADTLVTINGNVTSKQLWAGFGGTVNINETATVTLTYGDGWLTLRNGGTVNVTGTVEDALSLDISTAQAQFKHGYSSIGDARSSNNYANSTNVFNLINTFVDGGSWMNIGAATWNSGRNSVNMTNSVFKTNALNMYDDGKFNADAGSRVIVNGTLKVAEESAMTLSNNSSMNAKSVTVEAEATITQDATSTIEVSGNFVNDGTVTFDGTTTIAGNYKSDDLTLNAGAVFSAGSITVDALTMALGSSLTLTGTGTTVGSFTVTGDTVVDMEYQLVASGWDINYAGGEVYYKGETYTVQTQTDATSLTGINFVLGSDGGLYVKNFGAMPEQLYIGDFDDTWSGDPQTKVIDGTTYVNGYNAFETMEEAETRYPNFISTVTSVILVNETVADGFLLDSNNKVDTITVSALSGADEQNRTVSTIADDKTITINGELKLTVDLGAELSGGTIDVDGKTTVSNNGHLDTTLVSGGALSITNKSDYTLSGEYTAPSINLDNSDTAVDLTLTATTGDITINNSGTMTDSTLNAKNASVYLSGTGSYEKVEVNSFMLYLNGINFTFSAGEVGTVYLSDQRTSNPGGTLILTGGAVGMVDGFNFGSTMSSGTVIFDGADLSKTSLRDIQRLTLASGTSSFDESGMATYYMNELEIAEGATLEWNWTSDDSLFYNIGTPTYDDSRIAVVDADGTFAFTQSGEYALENFDVSEFAGNATVADGSTLNLVDAEGYFADGATVTLLNTNAKLNLSGYGSAEVATGMNFAGNGEIAVNADHSLTGDVSGFSGVYTLAADMTATFEDAAVLADKMTLNGEGTAEFATRATPAEVQITSDDLATNLVLNNNDATLVGGSYGTITTAADDGSISIIAGIKIGAGAVDVNALNISLDSSLAYTGPSLTVSGLSNDFGTITVTSDTAEFKSPYTLIATDDGVGFGSEITFRVGTDSATLTIGGAAVEFNNFWIQAYVEDGDLKIANVPGASGDILVNSDWPETAGAQVTWAGEDYIVDRDASQTVDRALEIVAPKTTGEASTITIVKADTYDVSNVAMTKANGVSNLVIKADSLDAGNPLTGSVYLSGDVIATDGTAAGTSLTLENLSVIGNLYGGAADAKLSGNASLTINATYDNAVSGMVFGGSWITTNADDSRWSSSLTVNGGVYAGAYLAGGYYAQGGVVTMDSSSLVVMNDAADKLLINGRLTGGGVARGAGASITQKSASVTIDSSDPDTDTLYLRGDIYAGGVELSGGSVSVENTSVTFTGLGDRLSFTSRVSGGVFGQTVGSFAGDSTLIFDDFTGTFQGLIQDFDTMKFTGDSVVTFSRKQTLSSEMNLEFSIEGRTNTTDAMFTVNQYGWVYGTTITITTGDFTTGSYVLADGYDFSSGLDFMIGGEIFRLDSTYTDGAGNSYTLTASDNQLVLDYKLNPSFSIDDDTTGEQNIAGREFVTITGNAGDVSFVNTESLNSLAVNEDASLGLTSTLNFSNEAVVTNSGTISGAENTTVLMASGVPITIVNDGEISATAGEKYNRAIYTEGTEARLDITNSGTINGAIYSNISSVSSDRSMKIDNTGVISVIATPYSSATVDVGGPLTLEGDGGVIEVIGYGSAINGYDGINVAGNDMTILSLVTDETAQDGENHEFYAITQNRDNAIEISGDGNQIIAKGTSNSGTYGIYESSTSSSAKVIVSGDDNVITADGTTPGSYGRSGSAIGINTRYASVEISGSGTQITADFVRLDGNASIVSGIYTDYDSASITISGDNTKINVFSQATNAPTTGIQADEASAITVTGNGTEITIDVNDANVAKAMGIVTGSVNGFYGGSITVGSFADDGSVAEWNDLKISITGNAAVEKGLYTGKGTISVALDTEGSISAATAIDGNNIRLFSKGTIEGNVTSSGSDADSVTLLGGAVINGSVNLGAGDEDVFTMDVDSVLNGALSDAETVNITGFDNLAGTCGAVGLIANASGISEGFQLDGVDAVLGTAQEVMIASGDVVWAELSKSSDGSLLVAWGDTEASLGAALDAFGQETDLAFGTALVSTDDSSFSKLSREEFSEKKNNGTLA